MSTFLTRAEELFDELIADRRFLHENPELGLETEETAAYVERRLIQLGYAPKRIGRTGVVATVGKPGKKVFLLRADMDALPITEESGLPFASKIHGRAHCCGHDTHTAMLLTAAKLLKERENELCGMVKLMFQPGEEVLLGARAMIDDGLLENPTVDAGMGLHINSLVPAGQIVIFNGMMTAASNGFQITVKGHGSHGARPHESIDPINAACHIYTGLQAILARELPASERAVLTIGSIQSGSAGNVVPDTAIMVGTLRTFDTKVRDHLMERIKTISQKIAEAFLATAEVEFSPRFTVPMVSDPGVAKTVKAAAEKLLPPERSNLIKREELASEDFAFVAAKVPCCFAILGARIAPDAQYGQHHPKVQFKEAVLPIGAALYTQTAFDWLADNC